jgi:Transposase
LKEHEADMKTAELCGKHNVSAAMFYQWKAKFSGMEVNDAKKLRHLRTFNLQRLTLKQAPPAAEDSPAVRRMSRSSAAILLLLTLVAIVRLLPTYTTFGQTYDEPFHIAAGMEWLDKGEYTYRILHPPLARVAVALGPYLSGLRWPGSPVTYEDWWELGCRPPRCGPSGRADPHALHSTA